MTLVDSYLGMLRLFLPAAQRDDVTRELAEEMRAQVADKQEELGRALTADEQAALLRPYGHPLLTAARYRPQQHLVGPVVFPYYWLALRVIVGLVVAGHLVAGLFVVGTGTLGGLASVGAGVAALLDNVFAVIAWVTIWAFVADWWLARSRVLETWDPKTLAVPPDIAGRAAQRAMHDAARSLRDRRPPLWCMGETTLGAPSTFRLVLGVALGVWWLVALRYPVFMFGPAAAVLAWGRDMDRLYPVLVVAQILALAGYASSLMWPGDRRVLMLSGWVRTLASAFFVYIVATSDHQWVVARSPGADGLWARTIEMAGRQTTWVEVVNLCFAIPFGLAAAFSVLSLLRSVYRWFSRRGGAQRSAAVCLLSLASLVPAPAGALPVRLDSRQVAVGRQGEAALPPGRIATDGQAPDDRLTGSPRRLVMVVGVVRASVLPDELAMGSNLLCVLAWRTSPTNDWVVLAARIPAFAVDLAERLRRLTHFSTLGATGPLVGGP